VAFVEPHFFVVGKHAHEHGERFELSECVETRDGGDYAGDDVLVGVARLVDEVVYIEQHGLVAHERFEEGFKQDVEVEFVVLYYKVGGGKRDYLCTLSLTVLKYVSGGVVH